MSILIEVRAEFCVFKQIYKNRPPIYGHGRFENAFKSRAYNLHFEIFTVEIIEFAMSMADAAKAVKKFKRKLDPILCLTNGIVYNNIEEAAIGTKMHPSAIRNHLNGVMGYEKPKGHQFQRVPQERTVF